VAEALLGCVRAEDHVARVGEQRFAVLASEGVDGQSLALRLRDHVRKHLRATGSIDLSVVAAAVDCQFDELTREQVLEQAEKEIARAIRSAVGEKVDFPPPASSPVGDRLPKAS
jgi:GGDEF domain-containing protein